MYMGEVKFIIVAHGETPEQARDRNMLHVPLTNEGRNQAKRVGGALEPLRDSQFRPKIAWRAPEACGKEMACLALAHARLSTSISVDPRLAYRDDDGVEIAPEVIAINVKSAMEEAANRVPEKGSARVVLFMAREAIMAFLAGHNASPSPETVAEGTLTTVWCRDGELSVEYVGLMPGEFDAGKKKGGSLAA